jgi:predicted RNA-binding Zn-ribbon protein involved in translation (DUF1610 family)
MVNPRFQVRDSEKGLEQLDEALILLGYTFGTNDRPDRARWYNECKSRLSAEARMKKNPCPKCGDWDYYQEETRNVCITCGHDWPK